MRRPRHAEPFASPVAMKARSGRLKAAEICVKAGAERKEHVVQAKGTGHGGKKDHARVFVIYAWRLLGQRESPLGPPWQAPGRILQYSPARRHGAGRAVRGRDRLPVAVVRCPSGLSLGRRRRELERVDMTRGAAARIVPALYSACGRSEQLHALSSRGDNAAAVGGVVGRGGGHSLPLRRPWTKLVANRATQRQRIRLLDRAGAQRGRVRVHL